MEYGDACRLVIPFLLLVGTQGRFSQAFPMRQLRMTFMRVISYPRVQCYLIQV